MVPKALYHLNQNLTQFYKSILSNIFQISVTFFIGGSKKALVKELPMIQTDDNAEENEYEVVEELDERIKHFNCEVISIFVTKRTFNEFLSETDQSILRNHYLELKKDNKVYIFYEHLKASADDATVELVMSFILKVEMKHNQFSNASPVYLVIMESVQGKPSTFQIIQQKDICKEILRQCCCST